MQQYGFTLRKVSKPELATTELYYKRLTAIEKLDGVKFEGLVFEHRPFLHVHGIITLHKDFYRKRLIVRGWKVKLVPIFDKQGWTKYMFKYPETQLCGNEVFDSEEHNGPDSLEREPYWFFENQCGEPLSAVEEHDVDSVCIPISEDVKPPTKKMF